MWPKGCWSRLSISHRRIPTPCIALRMCNTAGESLVLARSNFAAVLKLAPPAHNSRYFLGRISLLENKPREAVHWLAPVVAAGGSNFDAASQLAKAYVSTGEFSKAIGPLKSAIGETPWDGSLYYRLGQLLSKDRRAGTRERCLRYQQPSEVRHGGGCGIIMLRTSQMLASGKTPEAIDLSTQILEREVVEPDTLGGAGRAFG